MIYSSYVQSVFTLSTGMENHLFWALFGAIGDL